MVDLPVIDGDNLAHVVWRRRREAGNGGPRPAPRALARVASDQVLVDLDERSPRADFATIDIQTTKLALKFVTPASMMLPPPDNVSTTEPSAAVPCVKLWP